MRTISSAAIIGVAAALIAGPVGADPAEVDERSRLGAFGEPFREDGFAAGPSSCYDDGEAHRTCFPAGASQNLLVDGRILYWNAIEGGEDVEGPVLTEAHRRAGDARSRLLTLTGDRPGWTTPEPESAFLGNTPEEPLIPELKVEEDGDTPNDGSLFCSDNTFLADGRVLTVGGTDYYAEPGVRVPGSPSYGVLELEGLKSARTFDPATDTWGAEGEMTYGRWYPSLTGLADGRVLASSGVTKLVKPVYPDDETRDLDDSGRNVAQQEVFDPATGTWSVLPETADRSLPLYPRTHLLPNGSVYYDAAGQAFNPAGQGYDEALWNQAASFDPDTARWTELGIPGLTTGGDVMPEAGFRGSTFSQMLPLVAPYDAASFLSAGGVIGTTPGSYLPTSSARINRWSVDADGVERLDTHDAGRLAEARWYGSGVTLPDGSVLVLSGADLDHVITPGLEAPITTVERFVPDEDGTGGSWEVLADAAQGRTYHNAATLLPDGRVLVGGHDPIPFLYGPQTSLPGRASNEPDASFEIFSPPYLFADDGSPAPRPSIVGRTGAVERGAPLQLQTAGPEEVAKVVLVRNGSVTHLIDGDQRSVELDFVRSGARVVAEVPASAAVLPAGPYLLFVVDEAGTPSVARQVVVAEDGSASEGTGVAPAPTGTAPNGTAGTGPAPAGAAPARPVSDLVAGQPAEAIVSAPAAPVAERTAPALDAAAPAGPVTPSALRAEAIGTSVPTSRAVPVALAIVAIVAVLGTGGALRRRRSVGWAPGS